MKTELIAETWGALGADQQAFIEAFYARFFERFPDYRPLFPKELNPAHLAKMVQTMALLAHLSEERGVISPHMHRVGFAHRPYDLSAEDLANFKTTFVGLLGERLGAGWSDAAAAAWMQAFDEVLIPLLSEGMRSA